MEIVLKINCECIECNISHRRFVAVLFMLFKIRSNHVHPLCGALPVHYVQVRVTRGALVAHRLVANRLVAHRLVAHRLVALVAHRLVAHRLVAHRLVAHRLVALGALWNNLVDRVFYGVGLTGFKSSVNASLLTLSTLSLCVLNFLVLYINGWLCGVGIFGIFPALQ